MSLVEKFDNTRLKKVQNMKKLFILGLALLAACAANAIPTLTGPTGGFELPTADVATGTTVAVNLDVSSSPAYPDTNLVFGVCKGLEIGGQFEQGHPGQGQIALWNVNAKYQLPLDIGKVKIAVGGGYGQAVQYGSEEEVYDHLWNVYAAGTMPLWGTSASANIGFAKDSATNWQGITAGLAVEKSLNENTALGAEFIFGDKVGIFTVVQPFEVHGNIYLSRTVTKELSARVGLGGIGYGTDLYVGAAYKFGK